jgi:hypothetical protein
MHLRFMLRSPKVMPSGQPAGHVSATGQLVKEPSKETAKKRKEKTNEIK